MKQIINVSCLRKIIFVGGVIVAVVAFIFVLTPKFRDNKVVLIEGLKVPIKSRPTTKGINIPHQDKEIYKNLTSSADNNESELGGRVVYDDETPISAIVTTEDKNNTPPGPTDYIDEIAELATESEKQ
ncbi:MAG: hypothetical protein LBI30_01230 [Holosporales bacterium]|jgi:hypothetical protein|nr:hypothetical protein [Holosporales bacterium]